MTIMIGCVYYGLGNQMLVDPTTINNPFLKAS